MVKMNQTQQRFVSNSFLGTISPFKILLVCLVISPYLYSSANCQSLYEDKKSDPSRPFYMGSRYGRSGHQSPVQVTPRVDRFFLGSRYGKRASGTEFGEVFSPYATSDLQEDAHNIIGDQDWTKPDSNKIEAVIMPDAAHPHAMRILKCTYLGKGNLYNCFIRDVSPLSLL